MRRYRFGPAFAASLLLHGAIALLLIFRPQSCAPAPPPPAPASNDVVELDWVEEVAEVPPKVTPPPKHRELKGLAQKTKPQKPAPPDSVAVEPPPAAGQPPSPAPPPSPTQEAAPLASRPKLDLFPSTLPDGIAVPEAAEEPGHGHTFRPGDPSLTPEAKKAEEEFRVNGRVQEFAWDGIADARGQAGVAHPYFGVVGDALRLGLGRADGGTPAELGAASPLAFVMEQYFEGAAQYARTGNPGTATPGLAPRQSEKLREKFGSEGQWAQAFAQAAETREDLEHGRPLLSLTFELHQNSNGGYRSGKILEKSKSPRFDAFVMRVVPEALSNLPPPPQEVLHGRDDLRSIWRIEGWPKYSTAETLAPDVGVEGISAGLIKRQAKSDRREFDFRARLLKAYY